MQLCLINNSYKYEIEKLIRIFFPFEKIECSYTKIITDRCVVAEIIENKAFATLYFDDKIYNCERTVESINGAIDKDKELFLALAVYECLINATDYSSDWGILTGIRPAKLLSRLKKSMGEEAAREYFKEYLKVTDKKLELCVDTLKGEGEITSLSKPDSFSLYISIPFCPSRCSYCSFVSHSVENSKKLIPEYVEYLCRKLELTAKIAKKNKLRLETVYMGGGTPTTLSSEQLKTVLQTVSDNFDLSFLREYTVEAGRPDTVTKEKLKVIKSFGVTRISINPQTMNDDVLKVIGRKHTVKQTVEAFKMARECGFDNINMDLIAGLSTDTFDSFKDTVNSVIKLNPESVTVHSLSMKRSSSMTKCGEIPEIEMGRTASQMVDFAYNKLRENGIYPYYMYRQSKTVGNLENVGYSKRGFESLYNVYIMDETHTILACGASAVTKLREPCGDYIERIFNYKYPYEYINGFEEILKRKKGIGEFYGKFNIS